jgi:nicotinate-nucleotide adenylyltransferase
MTSKAVIFAGSFNPIHIGHLAIANYIVEFTSADECLFVVSPHNPFKPKSELAEFHHRINMANIASEPLGLPITVCDVENDLPQPSYTVNMLNAISEKYPDKTWSLLIGADNLVSFHLWKDAMKICRQYPLLVYPRMGFDDGELCRKYNALRLDAPIMEISSTFIRRNIAQGRNLRALVPCGVFEYIGEHGLYETKNRFAGI